MVDWAAWPGIGTPQEMAQHTVLAVTKISSKVNLLVTLLLQREKKATWSLSCEI